MLVEQSALYLLEIDLWIQ